MLFQGSKVHMCSGTLVNNLMRHFEICIIHQYLSLLQMSLFFVNASAVPARKFFLIHCSSRMPFDELVKRFCRQLSSVLRHIRIPSEMDGQDFRLLRQSMVPLIFQSAWASWAITEKPRRANYRKVSVMTGARLNTCAEQSCAKDGHNN